MARKGKRVADQLMGVIPVIRRLQRCEFAVVMRHLRLPCPLVKARRSNAHLSPQCLPHHGRDVVSVQVAGRAELEGAVKQPVFGQAMAATSATSR